VLSPLGTAKDIAVRPAQHDGRRSDPPCGVGGGCQSKFPAACGLTAPGRALSQASSIHKRDARRRPPQQLAMGAAVVNHWQLRDGVRAWLQEIRRELMQVEGGRVLAYSQEFIRAPPTPSSYSQFLRTARLATVAQQREGKGPRRVVELEEARFEEYDYYKKAGVVYRQRELDYAAAGATDRQIAEVQEAAGILGFGADPGAMAHSRPRPSHRFKPSPEALAAARAHRRPTFPVQAWERAHEERCKCPADSCGFFFLKASLADGWVLPLAYDPAVTALDNYPLSAKEAVAIDAFIVKMLAQGALYEVDYVPRVVSPLSVAYKSSDVK